MQKERRIIQFEIAGEVKLKDRVVVRHGYLTVDGLSVPGKGVTVTGGAVEFISCKEVLLRYFRVRHGDERVLQKLRTERKKQPSNSSGLDCISLHECQGVDLDHLSLIWSCDELLTLVRCQHASVHR